jgi:hypothetical protein
MQNLLLKVSQSQYRSHSEFACIRPESNPSGGTCSSRYVALVIDGGPGRAGSGCDSNLCGCVRAPDEQAFAALGSLPLRVVEPAELSAAVEGMGLTPQGKQALLADVAAPAPPQTPATQSATAHTQPLRLAWITLWDTDVEDGDVVRIDSEGYSRTIRLTKRGNTFAVPIPANGIITVTGIRDGDGGGITVGLASGPVKAIFPIMSTGQSLGLNVTIN